MLLVHGFLRSTTGAFTTFDVPGGTNTEVVALNNLGQVAGIFFGPGNNQGFLRNAAGGITTFNPPGSTSTTVTELNNVGQVAGSDFADGSEHGFLRDASGAITTFDPPGSTLTNATALNDLGQVAGTYVPSAVPTPASAVLLGTGLIGLLGCGWWRRRRQASLLRWDGERCCEDHRSPSTQEHPPLSLDDLICPS